MSKFGFLVNCVVVLNWVFFVLCCCCVVLVIVVVVYNWRNSAFKMPVVFAT